MKDSALLDTSFLISLVDASRVHHAVAVQYYRHMVESGVAMYLSAIVASEFGIRQAITDLPLNRLRILNFEIPHGQAAAELWNTLGGHDSGDVRPVVKDDVKLIAQASHGKIDLIFTEDTSTLFKYCERLRQGKHIGTRAIALRDGFDSSVFNEGGQKNLGLEDVTPEPRP